MDDNALTPILAMTALIVMYAYFSATETAFSSLNRIRLKNMAENGNARAKLALKLADDFDRLLSTILIGGNITSIAATSIATVFFVNLLGSSGVMISTIVVTVVILVFGDITPKSLAKESPQRLALFSAPIIRALMVILWPFNFLFMKWRKLVARVFKSSDSDRLTDEELLTIVEEAEQEGGIGMEESELIRSAIEFKALVAEDILTPRTAITAIDCTADKNAVAEAFRRTEYSRLPVYDGTLDRILGVIYHKDFYNHAYHSDIPLSEIIRPVVFVTPTKRIDDILRLLQRMKTHLAIVSDEYGGTVGLLTLEDIIEELVGEIWDEHDEVIESFEYIGENTYRIQCSANLDEMFEMFAIEHEAGFSTVSGWVMEELKRIPREGDSFTYQNLEVVVTKTDSRHVLEIMVTAEPTPPSP